MTPSQQAALEQVAREWLMNNEIAHWGGRTSALVTLLAAQRAAGLEEAVWTHKKPDREGWWWWRESTNHEPAVMKVYKFWVMPPHGGRYVLATTNQHLVEHMDGQWSSAPIAKPKEQRP